MSRRFISLSVVLLFLVLSFYLGQSAQASTTIEAPVPLTEFSPFPPLNDPFSEDLGLVTACMGPGVLEHTSGSGFGTIYRNSEAEPSIAVNPTDPQNIIVAYQNDRVSNSGGAVGIGVSYTLDGGKHWSFVSLPSTRCGGALTGSAGDFERDTDPWVVFGQDGTAYISTLPFNIGQDFSETFAVSKSADGGASWEVTNVLFDPTFGLRNLFDAARITADPVDPNTLYYSSQNYAYKGGSKDVIDPSETTGKKNQIYFAKITKASNGGLNVGPIQVILELSPSKIQQFFPIVGLPPSPSHPSTLVSVFEIDDNTLNKFPSPSSNAKNYMAMMRSFDHGATWSNPSTIDQIANTSLPLNSPLDFETSISFNTGSAMVNVDPSNGYLYASWNDGRFSTSDAVGGVIVMSKDGGNTWTKAINAVPNTPPHVSAVLEQMAVAADGTIGILFYDFRNDRAGDSTFDTDAYLSFFHPTSDPNNPLAFTGEVRLTPTSFDTRQFITRKTILSGFPGYFPGDYAGLSTIGNDFLAVYAISNQNHTTPESPINTSVLKVDSTNHQDIVLSRVTR